MNIKKNVTLRTVLVISIIININEHKHIFLRKNIIIKCIKFSCRQYIIISFELIRLKNLIIFFEIIFYRFV